MNETNETTETTDVVEPIMGSVETESEGAPAEDVAAESTEGVVASGTPVGPRAYDFQRPVGMEGNTRRLLERAFKEVVNTLETWLGAQLREPVKVSVDVLEEVRFAVFRRDLMSPCNVFLLQIEGESENAVMQIDSELAFTILERAFGSQAEQIHQPERALTWIERVVLRELVADASQIINNAWNQQLPLTLSVSGFEAVPEMLPQSNQDTTVHARLQIGGDAWASGLTLVLPSSAISTALARKREEIPAVDLVQQAENRGRIETTLQGATLPISVRLPDFPVSLRQISTLAEGTLVRSQLPSDVEVEIYVGEKLRFIGRVGRQGEHLAVEVLESIRPGVDRPDSIQGE